MIVITDGVFTDDAESVVVQIARALDQVEPAALPWQVGVQFFQIGKDDRVQRYLQELDDDLRKRCHDEQLRDIVDTVPRRKRDGEVLDAEGILKCVFGAVNKKLDRKQVDAKVLKCSEFSAIMPTVEISVLVQLIHNGCSDNSTANFNNI